LRSVGLRRARRRLEELAILGVPLRLELVDRDEAQRRRVDAVAQARRRGAVGEHVPEVRVRTLRPYLGARREELRVLTLRDMGLLDRLREAGPAGAGVELVTRAEKRLPRHNVDVEPLLMVVPVLVAERQLGALVLRHLILLRAEPVLQIRVARLRVRLL